jgi:hypothetical protein
LRLRRILAGAVSTGLKWEWSGWKCEVRTALDRSSYFTPNTALLLAEMPRLTPGNTGCNVNEEKLALLMCRWFCTLLVDVVEMVCAVYVCGS